MLNYVYNYIPEIIGLLTLVASEYFLPSVLSEGPRASRQRHFFSLLLTIFALMMSSTLKTSFETHQKITAVEKVFTSVTDADMRKHFQDIFTNYHKHFSYPSHSPFLKPWLDSAIKSLSSDMDQISVSLPSSVALEKVLDLYEMADDHIFAAHVGSLKRYFHDQRYRRANLQASKRNIPVVRFYLFDSRDSAAGNLRCPKGSEKNSSKVHCSKLIKFNNEVKKLHKDMNTFMSVVIPDTNFKASPRRDLLVADGNFLVETENEGDAVRVTGKDTKLDDARQYLNMLLAINVSSDYVHHLSDKEVRDRFGHYRQAIASRSNGEPLAKTVALYLIKSIGK